MHYGPMNHGRTPDTYLETRLLEALTPPERYAHGHYMTAGRLASWLGKPGQTIVRWRTRNQFPGPAGRAPESPGRYKVRHGWDYRDVLAWLRATGRLEVKVSRRAARAAHKLNRAPSLRLECPDNPGP